jgi:hypothetical protein
VLQLLLSTIIITHMMKWKCVLCLFLYRHSSNGMIVSGSPFRWLLCLYFEFELCYNCRMWNTIIFPSLSTTSCKSHLNIGLWSTQSDVENIKLSYAPISWYLFQVGFSFWFDTCCDTVLVHNHCWMQYQGIIEFGCFGASIILDCQYILRFDWTIPSP